MFKTKIKIQNLSGVLKKENGKKQNLDKHFKQKIEKYSTNVP